MGDIYRPRDGQGSFFIGGSLVEFCLWLLRKLRLWLLSEMGSGSWSGIGPWKMKNIGCCSFQCYRYWLPHVPCTALSDLLPYLLLSNVLFPFSKSVFVNLNEKKKREKSLRTNLVKK